MLVYYNTTYNTNSLFLRSFSYAHLPGLSTSIIKVLSVSENNFFILKFHCFMLLLNFIASKYSFFRRIIQVWYQYFQICLVLGQFPHKHFFYCTSSACSDCTEGSGSSTRVVFEKFLAFYFPFSQFPTMISIIFFLKFVICLVTSEVSLHFQCYKAQVVGLLSTK